MKLCKVYFLAFAAMLFCTSFAYSWGEVGHIITCRLAQRRLSDAAADAVSRLLPAYANDLASWCSWADYNDTRTIRPWSDEFHYIQTPDENCTYDYNRDCKDKEGIPDRCVAGAINNYTEQLASYGNGSYSQYNLTEALLFLSHFIGDIHQPLHVGFKTDGGGNAINVKWYNRNNMSLHWVWDTGIIVKEIKFPHFDKNVTRLIEALYENITTVWANERAQWEACNQTVCPTVYASEGIKAACEWAYNGVNKDNTTVLKDQYFRSRYPVVNIRLAQGGVRLAATLNELFKGQGYSFGGGVGSAASPLELYSHDELR